MLRKGGAGYLVWIYMKRESIILKSVLIVLQMRHISESLTIVLITVRPMSQMSLFALFIIIKANCLRIAQNCIK